MHFEDSQEQHIGLGKMFRNFEN